MSDASQPTQEPQETAGRTFPHLDPRYTPATEDSGLLVRWLGNTARVAELRYLGIVDPFQLIAFGDWIADKGRKMIAIAEAAEAFKEAERQAAEAANRATIAVPKPGFLVSGDLGRGNESLRRER